MVYPVHLARVMNERDKVGNECPFVQHFTKDTRLRNHAGSSPNAASFEGPNNLVHCSG